MNVTLLAYTPEPEKTVATAAKLCYSSSGISDLRDGLTDEKTASFIDMLVSIGHESVMEHVSFTFGIEGISRACSHQLVRHRIASYSQKSQRYVNENGFEFITPPEIEALPEAKAEFDKLMEEMNELANEDARFVLPNACETKIVVTMNVRSLFNFFRHRCCNRAQWEIRAVANEMLRQCIEVAPNIFAHAGPSCVAEGKCPEGKMTCGRFNEVREHFAKLKNS